MAVRMAEKARSVDDVGFAFKNGAQDDRVPSGSYSRSASWMIMMSPVASRSPRATAAPLPRFFSCSMTRTPCLPLVLREDLACAVRRPVVHDDELAFEAAEVTLSTRLMISRIVRRSLKAGMTIDSFMRAQILYQRFPRPRAGRVAAWQ